MIKRILLAIAAVCAVCVLCGAGAASTWYCPGDGTHGTNTINGVTYNADIQVSDLNTRLGQDLSGTFYITADIAQIGSWTPVGSASAPFYGKIRSDSGQHTISGMTITVTGSNCAMFAYIGNGFEARDILFDNCSSVATGNTVAILYGSCVAGPAGGHTSITIYNVDCDNCRVQSTGSTGGGTIGVINSINRENQGVTYTNCDIRYCYVNTQSGNSIGGICATAAHTNSVVSFNGCTVVSCIIDGSGGNNTGGIAGNGAYNSSTCTISNCEVSNSIIKSKTSYTGGLVGRSTSSATTTITNSNVMYCTVYSGTSYSGGILGFTDSASTATVTSSEIIGVSVIAGTSYAAGICPQFAG